MGNFNTKKLAVYSKSHVSGGKILNILLGQVVILLFLVLLNTIHSKTFHPKKIASIGSALGVTAAPSPSVTSLPIPTPTMEFVGNEKTFVPIPTIAKQEKAIKLAVFGDSMVDTMGERLEYLEKSLKTRFPQLQFELYNYGMGSQNAEGGFQRLKKPFTYQTRSYRLLPDLRPDILIIGSFAYNPFFPYDRDRHWLALTKIIEEAEKISSNVYILAEIAPQKSSFGRGPNGINWEADTSYEHATHIVEQLENAVGLSKTLRVSLINVFQQSQINSQKEGRKEYINSDDGIHPSVRGHELMANMIASNIELK